MSDANKRRPHPATMRVEARPHPAKVMQQKRMDAPSAIPKRPRHPATVVQRSARSQRSDATDATALENGANASDTAQPMWMIPVGGVLLVGGYYVGKRMGLWGTTDWSPGVNAVQTIQNATPDVNALRTLLRRDDNNVSISSCWATAVVLSRLVQGNKSIKGIAKVSDMGAQQVRQELTKLLSAPNLIYCAVLPDHHFLVIPVSDDDLMMIQGYQGVFNYIEWRTNSPNGGRMRKDYFINNMALYATKNRDNVLTASNNLFSYDNNTETEVADYVQRASSLRIVAISYFAL